MRFVYGLVGALLGAVLFAATAFFVVALLMQGDELGVGLGIAASGLPALIVGMVAGVIISQFVWRSRQKARAAGLPKRARYVIAGWIIGPILASAILIWAESKVEDSNPNSLAKRPSDMVLLAQFGKHRATLEKITQMVLADRRLTQVDQDWTDPDDPQKIGVSEQRIALYRSLLRSAGVPRGFQTEGNGQEIDFYYWLYGYAITSEADTGFAYLVVPPKQTIANLRDVPTGGSAEVKIFRPIQGHWYLFYVYEPE